MAKTIKPESRKEAIRLKDQLPETAEKAISLSAKYYYDGKQCTRGHNSPRDALNDRRCVMCLEDKNKTQRSSSMSWVENANAAERRAKNRAKKLGQLPIEYEQRACQIIYIRCAGMNREGLGAFEVDHFTPLAKGGLHTESNLRIMPKTLNIDKGTEDGHSCPFYSNLDDILLSLTQGENATTDR